ncbi:MAG: DsbA family protein, partial [Desulfovibrionaceae bacterium]|nr:DsbA family protein [Desulfovibrionaceae bacterium]
YERLRQHFGDQLVFTYIMSGLVRDVTDFMNSFELALPLKDGICAYNKRLATIYKSEESLGNLPIMMDGFHLFDENHRSSYPLNRAYKAAELCEPSKAEQYLYQLRRATICQGRQTTKKEELVRVAGEVGLDQARFLYFYDHGEAEKAFKEDLKKTRDHAIHSLPTCKIAYGEQWTLCSGLIGFAGFVNCINALTKKTSKI